MATKQEMVDFFVSRRGSAAGVAQEVADVLDRAGHTVIVQDYNFTKGSNFVAAIHDGINRCRHFIGLLTEDYDSAPFTEAEWTSFYALARHSGGKRRLIILRIADVDPPGLLAPFVYGNLFGVTDAQERSRIILDAAEGRSTGKRKGTQIFHGVPPHNPDYMNRSKLLEQIDRALRDKDRPTDVTPVALHGLGGVGKSSLATEYARQHAESYAGVWWASAQSRAVLTESLTDLYAVLIHRNGDKHPTSQDKHSEELAKCALDQLAESSRPWLLVYDNVTSPQDIRDFIPSAGAHLLITTRWAKWTGWATSVKVDPLKPMEATRLLLNLTRSNDRAGAIRLSKALGYLPLALDHAGAYIGLTGISFDRYAERATELVAKEPKGAKYSKSVAATFSLAIEQAIADCPATEPMLAFLSMLAPDQIPHDLVSASVLSEDDRDEALSTLAAVSLVSHESDDLGGRTLSLHRLVRAAMHRRLRATNAIKPTITSVIARMAVDFPDMGYSEPNCWPRCTQLLPHALALVDEAHRASIETVQLAQLLDGAANYLLGRGAYAHAESLFKHAVEIGERLLGPDHAEVGQWLNNYGNVFLNSGRYDEAKEQYFKAISIGVKAHGRDHVAVATWVNNLAIAFQMTNNHAMAEGYFRQALESTIAACGKNNRWYAARLHNLADLLRQTLRFDEAEPMYREAIEIGETVLGAHHSLVCDWRKGLANLLRDTRRYEEAEKLYRQVLIDLPKTVGDEHSKIAFTQEDFALLLLAMGRLEDARHNASQAIAIYEKQFGPMHRWTTGAMEVRDRIVRAIAANAPLTHAEAAQAFNQKKAS